MSNSFPHYAVLCYDLCPFCKDGRYENGEVCGECKGTALQQTEVTLGHALKALGFVLVDAPQSEVRHG